MNITFKMTRRLFGAIHEDLLRPHPFAAERVGWIRSRVGNAPDGALLVLAHDYVSVEDRDYVDDPSAGAMMGPAAIRKALQHALSNRAAMFHVHVHDHRGRPRFSGTDDRESAKFIPDFWHVRPELPHGAIVLSRDSACGRCWYPHRTAMNINHFVIVGAPTVRIPETYGNKARPTELSRAR